MFPVERTHPWARDQDWMPRSVRTLRWSVSGAIWGVTGLGVLGAFVAAPILGLNLWKPALLGGVGGAVLGERVGRAAYDRRVRRLIAGDIDLAQLRERDEGDIVHVRGRVEAETTLPGLLHGTPCVFRRCVFKLGDKQWVHEAGVDFWLVDASGERVRVRIGGGRLLVPTDDLMDYPVARFLYPNAPPSLAAATRAVPPAIVPATETVLRPGTEVDIVGAKTVTPDASGDAGDYRRAPMRATLQSGKELPLLVTPVAARPVG